MKLALGSIVAIVEIFISSFPRHLLFSLLVSVVGQPPLGDFGVRHLTLYICTVTSFSHIYDTVTDKSTTSISLRRQFVRRSVFGFGRKN